MINGGDALEAVYAVDVVVVVKDVWNWRVVTGLGHIGWSLLLEK